MNATKENMHMNLIPEIAKLLDLELGEEFKIFDAAGFDYGVSRLG